ncbi:putative lipoprotein [Neisseria meningitidis NM271]|nr:putative lipoprotein [Neisseria meningitidis NM271]
MVSKVTVFLTVQVLFDGCQSITWSNFNSGKRSMCLAIMAWAVC